MRSWKNGACLAGGLVWLTLGVAGLTDGPVGVLDVLLLAPALLVGLSLVLRGLTMGARRSSDGVEVRGVVTRQTFPRGSFARVDQREMDMLPLAYSYVTVVVPDGGEHSLVQLAQYSFVERRRGGVQRKADQLNLWLEVHGA